MLTLDYQAPRASFVLDTAQGVYALHLKSGASLPGIVAGQNGLLYIGKASSSTGLKGRCHFKGNTAQHSPRRSLAALLHSQLALVPKAVLRPDGEFKSWGLELASEKRLDRWMHDNLLLAVEPRDDAPLYEQEMIWRHQPPLNLRDCPQSTQHLMVSAARKRMADAARAQL